MSGVRQPFPWEADQTPRKVTADLESRPPTGSCGEPGAEAMAARAAGDPDPNRARRGARGAAAQVHAWLSARNPDPPSEAAVRARVNQARARANNK